MTRLEHYEMLDDMPSPGSKQDRNAKYRSSVPEGKSGIWEVKKFEVEKDLCLLRMMRDGRGTVPGMYTRLSRNGKVIMSDTDAEFGDLYHFLRLVKGRVLIHGLGLGIALQGALLKDVTHVDVVEQSEDVIKLVAPHFTDERVNIIQGDCFEHKWNRETKWDIVWHDIWDDLCGDNLPEMSTLKRKFGRRCEWQGCWGEEVIRRDC